MTKNLSKMFLTVVLVVAIVLGSTKAEEEGERQERIFAFYSTTSVTRLTTTTITGLETCFSTHSTVAGQTLVVCQGRSHKRISRLMNAQPSVIDGEDYVEKNGVMLDGSLVNDLESRKMEKREVPERSGKRLTIWSTNFTFITITSTSTLPFTTVTVSALCIYPGSINNC